MDQATLSAETLTQDTIQPDSGQTPPDTGAVENAPAPATSVAELAAKGLQKGNVAPSLEKAAPAAPAFSPNFKFSAMGKEQEIPEFMRSVIKDKKTQDYVQDLFSKAHGLPSIKERLQETREQLQEISGQHNHVMTQVTEARSAYQKGDLDTVFEILRIAPEKVLNWAVERVQLSQLPPEQRQAYEARRDAEKRAAELEKHSRSEIETQMQSQGQLISQMIDLVLERPDYQAAAQAYDARKGQAGSFRSLVVQVGKLEFHQTGKTLTPVEAAQKALDMIGGVPQAPQAPVATPNAPATPAIQKEAKKPTLPNLAQAGAKASASPAKKPMRSLDDLKRRYDEISSPQA